LVREAELERQHLAAAANTPVGLCMFDAERRLVFCNQACADLYYLPEALTRPGTPWEGCTEAQGFLLSRPLPARDIPEMLERVRAVVAGDLIEPAPEMTGEPNR